VRRFASEKNRTVHDCDALEDNRDKQIANFNRMMAKSGLRCAAKLGRETGTFATVGASTTTKFRGFDNKFDRARLAVVESGLGGAVMKLKILVLFVGMATVAAIPIGISAQRGETTDAPALRNEKTQAAKILAARVGQVLGAATACRDVARPRISSMTDMLMEAFKISTTNEDELNAVKQLYEKSVAEGQSAVRSRRIDCAAADRNLADLEQVTKAPVSPAPPSASSTPPAAMPSPPQAAPVTVPPRAAAATLPATAGRAAPTPRLAAVGAPPAPAAGGTPPPRATAVAIPSVPAPAPTSSLPQGNINVPVRGVADNEIRFGLSAPFSGPAKELGRQMKLGVETAFNNANDGGGINGRQLKLVTVDDGYEPTRTAEAMKQLYEKDQVFGIIGNVGTPTAAVAVPYALEHRMLFYGAFTGAGLLRRDPPDRYVFNYRASYAEETDAVVRYLVKVRRLRPEQIAVFAQQDSYGDAGFEGVGKAMRALSYEGTTPRLNYKRNTIDVDEAVAQLRKQRPAIKAVVMVATYRAAAKFIEKTRDPYPAMIYTNVSFVGSTALAEELMLLGSKYADGVIVTQVVPAVDSYSSIALGYKSALAAYFPGEAPDYVSLEGYVAANVLIEALKRTGPQLDTERLVGALESLRNFDLGLGTLVNFGPAEHQGLHKVWGTQLDASGHYQAIELQ
jgi:branched-chain amino acid transport system substrate-binding protein